MQVMVSGALNPFQSKYFLGLIRGTSSDWVGYISGHLNIFIYHRLKFGLTDSFEYKLRLEDD